MLKSLAIVAALLGGLSTADAARFNRDKVEAKVMASAKRAGKLAGLEKPEISMGRITGGKVRVTLTSIGTSWPQLNVKKRISQDVATFRVKKTAAGNLSVQGVAKNYTIGGKVYHAGIWQAVMRLARAGGAQ